MKTSQGIGHEDIYQGIGHEDVYTRASDTNCFVCRPVCLSICLSVLFPETKQKPQDDNSLSRTFLLVSVSTWSPENSIFSFLPWASMLKDVPSALC